MKSREAKASIAIGFVVEGVGLVSVLKELES